MSLFVYESSWLSVEPRVWVEGDTLRGRASLLLRLLSLFSYDRCLTVDRVARTVTVDSRWLWFSQQTHTVRFEEIARIEYKFASIGTSWSFGVGRTNQLESFSVNLVLQGEPEPLRLFSFRGDGAVSTGLVGVLLGDSIFDGQGTQESSSRRFVDILSQFTGATLGQPSRRLTDSTGRAWACTTCGRPGPARRAKCLYCGGAVGPQA